MLEFSKLFIFAAKILNMQLVALALIHCFLNVLGGREHLLSPTLSTTYFSEAFVHLAQPILIKNVARKCQSIDFFKWKMIKNYLSISFNLLTHSNKVSLIGLPMYLLKTQPSFTCSRVTLEAKIKTKIQNCSK